MCCPPSSLLCASLTFCTTTRSERASRAPFTTRPTWASMSILKLPARCSNMKDIKQFLLVPEPLPKKSSTQRHTTTSYNPSTLFQRYYRDHNGNLIFGTTETQRKLKAGEFQAFLCKHLQHLGDPSLEGKYQQNNPIYFALVYLVVLEFLLIGDWMINPVHESMPHIVFGPCA